MFARSHYWMSRWIIAAFFYPPHVAMAPLFSCRQIVATHLTSQKLLQFTNKLSKGMKKMSRCEFVSVQEIEIETMVKLKRRLFCRNNLLKQRYFHERPHHTSNKGIRQMSTTRQTYRLLSGLYWMWSFIKIYSILKVSIHKSFSSYLPYFETVYYQIQTFSIFNLKE